MAESEARFVLVLTTAGSEEQAESLAAELVLRELAACVNVVGPVCSVYRWKGEMAREQEHLLLIKTAEQRVPEVRAAIRELHTYEVPEILELPVLGGDPAYLAWLGGALGR
jgi:periplasmic divalent cation tolerance protein